MSYSESIKTLEKDFFHDHQISLPCPTRFGHGKRTQILGLCLQALVWEVSSVSPALGVLPDAASPDIHSRLCLGGDKRGKSNVEDHCLPWYHRNATESGTDVLSK